MYMYLYHAGSYSVVLCFSVFSGWFCRGALRESLRLSVDGIGDQGPHLGVLTPRIMLDVNNKWGVA